MSHKVLVSALYYKASCEKFKWPWQSGFISDQIAKYMHGGHSHEELMFDSSVTGMSFDPCFSSSARDGGCRFKSAEDVLIHPERWDILPVVCDMPKALEMLKFCKAQEGKRYDFRGILSFILPRTLENPDKWYCSEICDRAKELAGLWPYFYRSHPSESYWTQSFLSKRLICQEHN